MNELYMGTYKSAEGVGLIVLFGTAFKEGKQISMHVQYLISLAYYLREHFPDD